ncbi:hypothetical protein NL676_015299 [Syzygium grande]|nr:hypothetical protein NL676_015299 [Syzygium grande]
MIARAKRGPRLGSFFVSFRDPLLLLSGFLFFSFEFGGVNSDSHFHGRPGFASARARRRTGPAISTPPRNVSIGATSVRTRADAFGNKGSESKKYSLVFFTVHRNLVEKHGK